MKIKQLLLKNFASVHELEINLKDDVTFLVGTNGAGKTTVGYTSIFFILEGIALKGSKVLHGERFRFIGGNGPSATGQLILHDEVENIDITISRKITKSKTELKITASDNRQLPDNFIDDIFNIFSINPIGFAKLTPQEQAIALGINTAKYDALKKIAYDERTESGRNVKHLEGVVKEFGTVEKIEPVDLKKLLQDKAQIEKANAELMKKAQAEKDKKIKEAVEHNKVQNSRESLRLEAAINIKNVETTINRLKEELAKQEDLYTQLVTGYDEWPKPEKLKPIEEIELIQPENIQDISILSQQIEDAEAINKKATLYEQMLAAQKKLDIARTLHENKKTNMDKIESDRIAYIKSCNLPFSNITIDDAGGILINDRPFNETYFSKGEVLRIGTKLASTTNPKLKYIFVPDSQSIDEKNREKLFTELVEAGFQVVAEYVDSAKQKNHGSILLKESQVVETYNEVEDDLSIL